MLKLLICGSPLHPSDHQDQDHHDETLMSRSAGASPNSTPKRSRKPVFCRSHNNKDKNPYAARGLDKFSELLADLEEKRRKIYAQTDGSEDISFVRFVYKNSDDLVPIVVKMKDNNKKEEKTNKSSGTVNGDLVKDKQSTQNPEISHDKFPIETSVALKQVKGGSEQSSKFTKRSLLSWKLVEFDRLRRPSYYLPLVVILILIFLAVFGRSVAILCTSIGWYVVPTLKDSTSRKRTTVVKKKDYVKKLSERKMVTEGTSSPRINIKSPKHNGHQRSW